MVIKRVLLFVLFCFLSACSKPSDHVQGYVEGELIYVAAQVSGRLQDLDVQRGQRVQVKQALFKLSPDPERQETLMATADYAAQKATLADIKLGERPDEIKQIQADIAKTKDAITYYKKQASRYQTLADRNAASKQSYDQAKLNDQQSVSDLNHLAASLSLAQQGSRVNQIEAQAYSTQAAKYSLAQAQWAQDEKIQKAAGAGLIVDTYYLPGEYVAAGQAVLSLLSPQHMYVVFFVPETRLASVQVGDEVSFSCDSCKDGKAAINYISSEAEYTPPVIYSDTMRTKLVYEVKALITKEDALSYHPGQPVDVDFSSTQHGG